MSLTIDVVRQQLVLAVPQSQQLHRIGACRPTKIRPDRMQTQDDRAPAVRSGISPVFHGWVQTVSGVFTSLGVVATLCVLIVEQRRYRADQGRARSDQTRLVLPPAGGLRPTPGLAPANEQLSNRGA